MKVSSIRAQIEQAKTLKRRHILEKTMPIILFLLTCLTVLTTIGIVCTLLIESFTFFQTVSLQQFFGTTTWLPFSSKEPMYGIWPLIVGTFKVALIAIVVAVPVGLSAAIFLSEYASKRVRNIVKPVLEILAGIPTIVYGFFALTFVTPILQSVWPSVKLFNAISPGIVIGIMILPMIISMSEDAMAAVPETIRDAAFALGATKLEVSLKIVLPAAISGVIASIVLAMSRAIGETMIVALAGGATPTFNFDVTQSIQTMTAYIVQVATGDAGFGTTIYYSIYAVGFTLFLFTFAMNLFAQRLIKRFKEVY